MEKRLAFALLVVVAVGIAFFAIRNSEFLEIDTCLDSGGCWDYDAKVCRRDEANAQHLCDRSMNK